MRWIGCFAAIFLALVLPAATRADDETPGLVLPGLRSNPRGRIESKATSLYVHGGNVSVTLKLSAGKDAALALRTPRFGWIGDADPYPDRHFPELKILLDGKPAAFESRVRAFVGRADVTAVIRGAGLDPLVVADSPPFVVPKEPGQIASLEKLGVIHKSDDGYLADWEVERDVNVEVAAAPRRTLTLAYKARPTYGLFSRKHIQAPALRARYCLSRAAIGARLGRQPSSAGFPTNLYAIPATIDGHASKAVEVEAVPLDPNGGLPALVAFCGADGRGVVGGGAGVKGLARTDGKGVVHILAVGKAP